MKLGTFVKTSFIVSILLSLFKAYFKITHLESDETLLTLGIISTLLFIVSSIYEVRTSNKIPLSEKNMWTVAFLFFSSLAGIIYFLMARRRIATND